MDKPGENKSNTLDKRMHKKVEVKEDGRLLMYYNFSAASDNTNEQNKHQQTKNDQ